MLDRQIVKEFLEEKLEGVEIPKDISFYELLEMFCKYCEDDTQEWLKDNFRSLFPYSEGDLNWENIREKIKKYK